MLKNEEIEAPPRVLIVDDDKANRELLAAFLHNSGYELLEAASGPAALALAQSSPPDLVLLDIMMPQMDGFETTRRLKALAGEAFLPIVLVTALGDSSARLRGFEAGADEFLEKPVNRHELALRLRNLLQLRRERQRLAAQNQRLVELQLFHEQTTSLLVHDLKNPLSVISMNIRFTAKSLPEGNFASELHDALDDAEMACNRLRRRVAGLLDAARSQEHHFVPNRTPIEVQSLLRDACRDFLRAAKEQGISLNVQCSSGLRFALDDDLMRRTLENLVENAMRFTPPGGRIELRAEQLGDALELRVSNEGMPIPPELRTRVFERFTQGPTPGTVQKNPWNQGLGLYFCKLAVEAHGGTIEVVDDPSFPTSFRIVLLESARKLT